MMSLQSMASAPPREDAETLVAMAKRAERNGRRLTRLIETLLDVTRIEKR